MTMDLFSRLRLVEYLKKTEQHPGPLLEHPGGGSGEGGGRVTPTKRSRDEGTGVRHCAHGFRANPRLPRKSQFVHSNGDALNPFEASLKRAIRTGGLSWRPSLTL